MRAVKTVTGASTVFNTDESRSTESGGESVIFDLAHEETWLACLHLASPYVGY